MQLTIAADCPAYGDIGLRRTDVTAWNQEGRRQARHEGREVVAGERVEHAEARVGRCGRVGTLHHHIGKAIAAVLEGTDGALIASQAGSGAD